jgi:hypothetical protein
MHFTSKICNPKAVCLFLGLLLLLQPAKSQSVEESFKNLNNCIDIEIEAMKLMPKFYELKQIDSVELILDYVKLRCTETESLRLTRLLIAIERNEFTDTTLKPVDIWMLIEDSKKINEGRLSEFARFRRMNDYARSQYAVNNPEATRLAVESDMRKMLITWGAKLTIDTIRGSLQQLVLDYCMGIRELNFIGDYFFFEFNKKKYKNTAAQKNYGRFHDQYMLNRGGAHLSWGYHASMPAGNAADVYQKQNGLFIILGVMLNPKHRIDFYTSNSSRITRNPIEIKRKDTSFGGRIGQQSYLGFNYIYTLWRSNRRFDVNVLAGGGMEQRRFFEEVDEDSDIPNEPADIINLKMGKPNYWKPYVLAGMEFKYFFTAGAAINISPMIRYSSRFNKEINSSTNLGRTALFINIGLSGIIAGPAGRKVGRHYFIQ